MKHLLLPVITICLSVIHAQDDALNQAVGDIYGNGSNLPRDPTRNLIEVTTKPPESIGALEKCGEGSQLRTHKCVPYYQCDINMMIIQNGSTNGAGVIDIRFGANACQHYLDNCCRLPPTDGMREPVSEIPVDIPVSSEDPPVVSVSPPVVTQPPVIVPVTPRPSSVNCGIRNPNGIDFKIIGNSANEAEFGEFPWMVSLLWKNSTSPLIFCGGSLIAPNVVLTGAHCIAVKESKTPIDPNAYKVRAGEWDTQTDKERLPYQERDIAQVIIHENYEAKVVYNDVALLILSSPFDQADNIGTVCLPSQNERITSRNCFVSGWGKKVFGREGQFQAILKKIELPMIEFEDCQRALRRTRLGQQFNLHSSFTCAGGELGKDACTGDGGSPLVCPDPRNPERYVHTGIVSWGIGCGEETVPGVYANVPKFRSWIDNQFSRLNINTKSYNV